MNSAEQFQYLAVLLSIVLGLGVTQLLTGVGRLVQSRERVRVYWPALVWVALLLLIHVQTWWAMVELRTDHGWTFLKFLVVLLTPACLYVMAALALPDVEEATANGRVLDLHRAAVRPASMTHESPRVWRRYRPLGPPSTGCAARAP